MSAAILQGVPATTLDTDLWIDLPSRQYMRVLQIARELGANVLAPTVIALSDDSMVNFLYRVDGLKSFRVEAWKAERVRWLGLEVSVIPLSSIIRSKEFVACEKDLAHLPLLRQALRLKAREPPPH